MKQTAGIALAVLALAAAPALAQAGQSGSTAATTASGSSHTSATKTGATKAGTSKAGQTKSAAATKAGGVADQAFAKEAAVGGLTEVELGNLAKQNAASQDVKQFGDRMVTDHSKANDELKQWASQKNVTLPTELDAKHKATRDRLAKLNGAAFDKAYMHDMVMDHQQDVAAFKKESTSGKDADLKAWAGKTLPTLQDHLKMAQDTNAKVGGSAAAKRSTKSKKK